MLNLGKNVMLFKQVLTCTMDAFSQHKNVKMQVKLHNLKTKFQTVAKTLDPNTQVNDLYMQGRHIFRLCRHV